MVNRCGTAGLAGDHHLVGGGERFARGADRPRIDAGLGAFTEKQIDDLVRNPVANLVRMTLRNRLTREQIRRAHQPIPSRWAAVGPFEFSEPRFQNQGSIFT